MILRTDSVSGTLNNYYWCIVTLNGSNFTSNPTHIPAIQCEWLNYRNVTAWFTFLCGLWPPAVPSPMSVSISSNMDNPISYGSSPTLTCTVSLSPAIDVDVEIIVDWSGPTYGLKTYTITQPVLNSSAEVPIYTSTATFNAIETFYDSGQYYCSVVLNPLTNRDVIRSTSAVSSPQISGVFAKL